MKRIIFSLLCLLLSINAFTQLNSAKIKLVDGIVISKYSKNTLGSYCEMETYLIYNGDTIRLFQKSVANIYFLEKYPSLKNVLGDYADYNYDYLLEWSKGIYKHDLSISNYNFLTEELGSKIVKSISFFTKDGCDNLYSIYQFTGLVVFYFGSTILDPAPSGNCFFPKLETSVNNFAVLKEAVDLKPLKETQIVEMQLIKSGIRSIEVFYME
ncbi:hypothetical protein [uncultured Bacteroides sp.]|uniref:hypothetical protein n=1 Tax=uncultured Bacteroides sp. TaxID=162156 RepID=UPI002AAC17A4|nr:hypothetical protein [uncultured Bacteroides sp.]